MSGKCANCGTPTPYDAMLRDRTDGTWHCTICPGEDWLFRHYGPVAVAQLRALRAGKPFAPTLRELVAMYPEKGGYYRKHRLSAA
jgi:hypothetical protein